MECDHTRRFWEAAERFFDINMPRLQPGTWSRDILDHNMIKKETAAIMITVMWAVWHSRNSYTHGEQEYQPMQSIITIEEIVRALEVPANVKPQPITQPRGQPRDVGWVKINTDGATDSEHGQGGAGFVVRDHHGSFVRAGCS